MTIMLKVASYNIRKAIGTDRRRNPDRIIDVLAEVGADIVALQEADRRFGKRVAVLPEWLLEQRSPYRAVPLGVRTESMGWHGNALLMRREHELIEHDIIHLPCLEPRGAVTATIRTGARTIRVVGMHLDLSGLWRRRQAAAVVHYLGSAHLAPVDATILMGDLNEWGATRGCIGDLSRSFRMVPCARSYHATRPVATLDRIFWSGSLALAASGAHRSSAARSASDHLPVWAQFQDG